MRWRYLALLAPLLLTGVSGGRGGVWSGSSIQNNSWRVYSASPLIEKFRLPAGLPESVCTITCIPNDPSVLYGTDCPAGSGFCMWYGMGVIGTGSGVAIYYATSPNGVDWTDGNGGSPVLTGGAPGTWNDFGSETPSVIKAGAAWLMAITAYLDPTGVDASKYTMGITTSADGVTWGAPTELTELTSVIAPIGQPCVPDVWGSQTRAEPGLLYVAADARPYKLVFADIRCHNGAPDRGISLADSVTGAAGTWAQVGTAPILTRSEFYSPAYQWQGYSTPSVIKDGSTYRLFADAFRIDGESFRQRGIATFEGTSLTTLHLSNPMAVAPGTQSWMQDVRSPSVVRAPCGPAGTGQSTELCMFFAADNAPQAPAGGQGLASVGVAGVPNPAGAIVYRAREFGEAQNGVRIVVNAAGAWAASAARTPVGWILTITPQAGQTAAQTIARINTDDIHKIVHTVAGGDGTGAPGVTTGVNLSGGLGPPFTAGIGLARSN